MAAEIQKLSAIRFQDPFTWTLALATSFRYTSWIFLATNVVTITDTNEISTTASGELGLNTISSPFVSWLINLPPPVEIGGLMIRASEKPLVVCPIRLKIKPLFLRMGMLGERLVYQSLLFGIGFHRSGGFFLPW